MEVLLYPQLAVDPEDEDFFCYFSSWHLSFSGMSTFSSSVWFGGLFHFHFLLYPSCNWKTQELYFTGCISLSLIWSQTHSQKSCSPPNFLLTINKYVLKMVWLIFEVPGHNARGENHKHIKRLLAVKSTLLLHLFRKRLCDSEKFCCVKIYLKIYQPEIFLACFKKVAMQITC